MHDYDLATIIAAQQVYIATKGIGLDRNKTVYNVLVAQYVVVAY